MNANFNFYFNFLTLSFDLPLTFIPALITCCFYCLIFVPVFFKPGSGSSTALALIQLMRFDRPVGTILLCWPVLWALLWSWQPNTSLSVAWIYLAGVVVMRALGCVWNDYRDRDIDGQVARTRDRPLPAGRLSLAQVRLVMAVLAILAWGLASLLAPQVYPYAVMAGILAFGYPYTKRFFPCPQAVLGIAFASSVPMVFISVMGQVTWSAVWLWLGVVTWVVGYDTWYACVDRDDDVGLAIYSSALWWGQSTVVMVAICYMFSILCWCMAGWLAGFSWVYQVGCLTMAIMLMRQVYRVYFAQSEDWEARSIYFQVFLANAWQGAILALALWLERCPISF